MKLVVDLVGNRWFVVSTHATPSGITWALVIAEDDPENVTVLNLFEIAKREAEA